MNKINILAIDSSLDSSSVALLYKKKILNEFIFSKKNHLEKLLFMIRKIFFRSCINFKKIDVLGFSCGPGSFSGVRVSVGIAQSLAFALNLKIISISSLLMLAQGVYRKFGIKKVLIALDAKMGKIYTACYIFKNGFWFGKKTESMHCPKNFLKKIFFLKGRWAIAGSGWSIYPFLREIDANLYETNMDVPNALDMVPLILDKFYNKKFTSIYDAQPTYFN